METISMSQMADFIIVLCFFVAVLAGWMYVLAEIISGIIDFVHERHKLHKELKALKDEISGQESK